MSYPHTILLATCVTCFGVLSDVETRLVFTAKPDSSAIAQTIFTPEQSPALKLTHNVLELGSRGRDVAELQSTLKKLGYYDSSVDGIYGDVTQAAVIEFQQKKGLPTDGRVDASVLQQLRATLTTNFTSDQGPATGDAASSSSTRSPLPHGASEETASSSAASEAVSTQPTDEATSKQGGSGWLWWGGIGLLIAATGVALAFYKLNRPTIKQLNTTKSPPIPPASSESHTISSNLQSGESMSPALAALNGSEPSPGSELQVTPTSETTRLAKVDVIEELLRDLRNPDPVKRRKAIWELGQVGDSRAAQPLVDLMMDSDSSQRSLILASISEIGIRALKPINRALLLSLQDPNSEVRKNAIRDVTRVYDLMNQISQLLAHAVSDPDTEVQETARWALTQFNRFRNVPELTGISGLPNNMKVIEHLPEDTSIGRDI